MTPSHGSAHKDVRSPLPQLSNNLNLPGVAHRPGATGAFGPHSGPTLSMRWRRVRCADRLLVRTARRCYDQGQPTQGAGGREAVHRDRSLAMKNEEIHLQYRFYGKYRVHDDLHERGRARSATDVTDRLYCRLSTVSRLCPSGRRGCVDRPRNPSPRRHGSCWIARLCQVWCSTSPVRPRARLAASQGCFRRLIHTASDAVGIRETIHKKLEHARFRTRLAVFTIPAYLWVPYLSPNWSL